MRGAGFEATVAAMSRRALGLAFSVLSLVACDPVVNNDAGTPDGGGADTGPPPTIAWTESAPLPEELAYAAATLLTSGTSRWIFVVGGATASGDTIGTTSTSVLRAPVNTDGSLGAWETIARVGREPPGMPVPVSQHGILRLTGEDLRQGFCIAGGNTGGGEVPLVLATYVSPEGTLDSPWGAFSPRITAGQGQWRGTFMPFDPHALALVGGLTNTGVTARVQFAQIYLGVDVPTFTEGPPLPAPRADHSWVGRNRPGMPTDDLFVLGGLNDDGSTDDVLQATRNAEDVVDGWRTVGTLPSAPHGHASVLIGTEIYVLGGAEGSSITGRVRRAELATDGTVGTFEDVADATLPVPLANAAMVQDDVIVYLIGGRTGADGASSNHVLIGRF